MLRSLIPLLLCPACEDGSLEIAEESAAGEQMIENGSLRCRNCGGSFPIESGIPRLLPPRLIDAQQDEIAARDAQVEQYDANTFLNLFGKWEMPLTLKRLNLQASDRLVEGGCGTGRMTQILARRCAEVVALDFSFASLLANRRKLSAAGINNVHLIQADLCHIPIRSEQFDRVLSCQVLEHVPDDKSRADAVASLARVARDSARVVISAYRHSPLMGAKQGRHDGGIPFFRFSRGEFHDLLASRFFVTSITGALVYLHLAQCEKTPEQLPNYTG